MLALSVSKNFPHPCIRLLHNRPFHRLFTSAVLKKYGLPERPQEPTTCCMSGCVNCVWDIYNDDMKEFNAAVNKIKSSYQARGESLPQDLEQELSKESDIDPAMKAFLEMEKSMKK
ncbi:hypothetical protein K493DRAFT_409240 [Basidiobolus meristosporus CBS 931.73]|uniref:Oxidoreductase-like domain-containing protein n=1 Tax=Basidiobolus meristosporus CBS 931.73 TaxID=1314790 RepID=A0A1Y1Y0S5_9FUNG|nr:hypothetical protein K493DRAFT_409240 [Basidiobolus meristosporus CBS 931.73]|eukprot:ORX91611.1 hypothetical protein K493DRAFT_409240 [Basidiobolus meristosporus CBS 931.73]